MKKTRKPKTKNEFTIVLPGGFMGKISRKPDPYQQKVYANYLNSLISKKPEAEAA